MNLLELIEKHDTKNEVIIKRKIEILEFTIKAGIILKYDLNIYIDSEKLCIGKTSIEMKNLKKIYLFKVPNRYGGYACSLEIVGKNMLNSKSLTITTLSEEDLDKIDELFNYFIFSNQTDYNILTSNNYEFLYEENLNIYGYNFNVYNENQKATNCLTINNKEYLLIKVLPKSYYKKYLNKNYILFESKCQNSNYMDVWIEKNKFKNDLKIRILLRLFIAFTILILILISIINSIITAINSHKAEKIRQEKQYNYIQEINEKKENIKKLLPNFNIYYEDGYIYRDTYYENPVNTDIVCIFEFENGEKYHRLFNKENKIDLKWLNSKNESKCKIYVIYRGTIMYKGKEEFIKDAVISNIINLDL